MARYVGPVCRLCRREGTKLFLKGTKCYSDKCALEKRNYAPGQHGKNLRKKVSNYGTQLREKQKLRRIYGLTEKQFRNYFHKATLQKGASGENFLALLERRLDNVIFRLGFGSSRSECRQFVRHGHVLVNGRKVDIPSFQVKIGEVISIKEKDKTKPFVLDTLEEAKSRKAPEWLEVDYAKMEGRVLSMPTRETIDTAVNELLVVEFYSR